MGTVVAIDGPAGTGKSTITKIVSEKLNFVHVDTGALYRSIALAAYEQKLVSGREKQLSDEIKDRVSRLAKEANLEFKVDDSKTARNRVYLNGRDVTEEIRAPDVTMASSRISAIPAVRAALLGIQRRLGLSGNAVLEGRDIGTVIFPDADAKFFLTASLEERARRRQKDLADQGVRMELEEIKRQISARDDGDSSRKVAPLKKAADAVEIDTTDLTIEQVVDRIIDVVRKKVDNP